MMHDLTDRIALVTGGSAGIGFAIARALAARGTQLVLAARSRERLNVAADELRRGGADVLVVPTDVARFEDLQNVVQCAEHRFGTIDVLVNNAGIETYHAFETLPVEEIRQTVDVNLTAALVLTRLVVPGMLDRGRGHVLNVSSTAGKHGPPFGAAYGATKAGLISLSESIRVEYRRRGVSATALCPGFVDDGGMYERMKRDVGKGAPPWVGSTSVDAVARAAVRAIRRDKAEIIVNRPPYRPVSVLAEAFPALGEQLYRLFGRRFLAKLARARDAERESGRAA